MVRIDHCKESGKLSTFAPDIAFIHDDDYTSCNCCFESKAGVLH